MIIDIQKKSMTNKRNPEMAKNGVILLGLFGLLVIIIIGIALAVYFISKKDDEETSKKPEFTFDANAKKTINPQKGEESGTQEGYRIIEYAESDLDKSKLIDLTLSWTNGQGFDAVNKIILTRYVDGTQIQEDIEVTDKDMIKNYGSGSATFKGSDVTKNARGVNVIKAYYNEVSPKNLLSEAETDITAGDFNYTLEDTFDVINVPVKILSDTFKLTKYVKKIYYNLSLLPHQWFKIKINSDGTYSFISINSDSDTERLSINTIDKFRMKTYKGKKILIHPSDDKKIVVVSLDNAEFKSESDMTRQDWGRASFTLTAATTIATGDTGDYGEIKKGEEVSKSLYTSPNGEYRLKFQDDGNLVVRKKDNTVMWESETTGDNKAKRIAVRPRYADENNSALTFTKTDDWAGGNIVKEYRSISSRYSKPYTLILDDTGILSIIDKNGFHTEALDFIASEAKLKPGDAFACGDEDKAYRYIGHNQKNHYAGPGLADRMDGQWGSFVRIDEKYCKNTRDGPQIDESVVNDFPQLVYDDSIDLKVPKRCTNDINYINRMKLECENHETCGGLGQQENGCVRKYSGKGYRWPESAFTNNIYDKRMYNFGLGKTSDSYLFRM